MDGSGDSPAPESSGSSAVCRCKKYMPYVTMVGSGLFVANYVNPDLLRKLFCKKGALIAQNTLFAAAHIGAGITLYDRLPPADQKWKSIAIAGTGSLLFNHGSLMLVGVVKEMVPDNSYVKMTAGAVTMGALFYVGREFFQALSN